MALTALYPIIGLLRSTGPVSAGDWLSLVALGVLFHVYAHVANDVIDLSLDLTDPRRGRDPMVLGRVSPQWGLWLALSTTPVMALLLLGHPIVVAGSLAAGVALLAAMTSPASPPGSLPSRLGPGRRVVGTGLRGGLWRRACGATWWAAGLVAFVALVNGVHGAVRDVENDRRAGANTTAVVLGARIREDGILLPPTIVSSPRACR